MSKENRILFAFDVAEATGKSVERVFRAGIGLARMEKKEFHARSLECRLPILRSKSKYMVGKMLVKQEDGPHINDPIPGWKGIQFVQIIP